MTPWRRALLALAVLWAVRWHWSHGDEWVTVRGLVAQTTLSMLLVAIATRVSWSFAGCVAIWQPITWATVYGATSLADARSPMTLIYVPREGDRCVLDARRRLGLCPLGAPPFPLFSCLAGPNYKREMNLGVGAAELARAWLDPPEPLALPETGELDLALRSPDLSVLTPADRRWLDLRSRYDPASLPVGATRWQGNLLVRGPDDRVRLCPPEMFCLVAWTRTSAGWSTPEAIQESL